MQQVMTYLRHEETSSTNTTWGNRQSAVLIMMETSVAIRYLFFVTMENSNNDNNLEYINYSGTRRVMANDTSTPRTLHIERERERVCVCIYLFLKNASRN